LVTEREVKDVLNSMGGYLQLNIRAYDVKNRGKLLDAILKIKELEHFKKHMMTLRNLGSAKNG